MSFHFNDVPDADTPEFEEALDAAFYSHRGIDPPESEPEPGGSEDPAPVSDPPGDWTPEAVETIAPPPEDPHAAPVVEEVEDSITPPPPAGWEIGGRHFEETEGDRIRQIYEWVEEMDPQFARAIGLLASGEYTLAPVQAQPDPTPAPDPYEGLDEEISPQLMQLLRTQQEQMAQLQEQLAISSEQSTRANDFAARELFEREAGSARASFKARYNLDDEFLDDVSRASAQHVGLFRDTSNSAYEVFDQALEHTLWTTPEFRAKIQTQEARRLANETAEIQHGIDEKKQLQSAVAAATGSVPRSEPTNRKMTPTEHRQAMISEVQEYLQQP